MSAGQWRETFAAVLGVLATFCALFFVLFLVAGEVPSAFLAGGVALVSGVAALWLRLGAAFRLPQGGDR